MPKSSIAEDRQTPSPRKNGFQTGGVLAISVSHFIHDVYSSFLAPLLPLLIEKLSMSLTQAGFLSTVMQLPALLNPYIGVLADRVSVRYFIILAPAMTAIPMSLLGLAPSYGVLLILLFVAGISVAIFHVPAPVMVSRLSGANVGRGMSFFMTGGELARTVGPLVAVGAVFLFGFENYYPVMLVGFVASGWLYFKLRHLPVINEGNRKGSIRESWSEVRHIMLPLFAILLARAFMHGSMTVFLPTFITMDTGNLWLAGAALTVLEAAGVVGVLTAGSLSDRFGRRRVLVVALVGAPFCLLMFVWAGGWVSFVMLVFTGITLLSTTPVMLALVQESARKNPAAANGIFMAASFIVRSGVVVIIGLLGDGIGLRMTYIISAGIGVLGIPFIFLLPKK